MAIETGTIDLTVPAKDHVRECLRTLSGSGLSVYGRKATRKPTLPFVTIRKVGEDGFDYLDSPGIPSNSMIRVELRAATDKQCDEMADEIDDAIRSGGRLIDRSVYFEGVEADVTDASKPDALYRITVQYRISET